MKKTGDPRGKWIGQRKALKLFHASSRDSPALWAYVRRGSIRTREEGGLQMFNVVDLRRMRDIHVAKVQRDITRRLKRRRPKQQRGIDPRARGPGLPALLRTHRQRPPEMHISQSAKIIFGDPS